MQTQYINEMLHLPEFLVHQILSITDDELHIEVRPLNDKQICPVCRSDEDVIRKGSNDMRIVRHLSVFEKKAYLHVRRPFGCIVHAVKPVLFGYTNMSDPNDVTVTAISSAPKPLEQSLGSTAAHSARIQHVPASTVQRMHNEAVPAESERICQQAWTEAKETTDLVLGVDDFAIKKDTYNTGIHNLGGETMLDLLSGRKLDELRAYASHHPDFLRLTPKAVVMDLAQTYHSWISKCFPNAIRIADRFHVHGYVIESVQAVRKTVQSTLSTRARAILKTQHRLLDPPADTLPDESKKRLEVLLSYSQLLRSVWEWKKRSRPGMTARQTIRWPCLALNAGASKVIKLTTRPFEAH